MKVQLSKLLCLAVLLFTGPSSVAAAAHSKGHSSHLNKEYVRLTVWAHSNEFTFHWLDHEKTLELNKGPNRMVFNVDSSDAVIDGVHVWLCFPILFRHGSVLISQLDLDKTLSPLLEPPANAPGIRIRTICLDPGHGGSDPGNRVGSREEKHYALLLAKDVREQLKTDGFKVVMTRTTDKYVDLSARPALARKHHADLFVSLHFNSTSTSRKEAAGVETYCVTPPGAYSTNTRGKGDTRWVPGNDHDGESLLLAYHVQSAMVKALPTEDRGVRRARFLVLREARMPAILVEGGFMSNPTEGRRIFDPAYRSRLARAIANGILAYQKAVKG